MPRFSSTVAATSTGVAALLGVAVATLGLATLLPLALLAAVALVIRLPGVVLAAYLLIPFYKGFLQDFIPFDLTIALALANIASLLIGVVRRERLRIDPFGLALWVSVNALVALGVVYAPDRPLAAETAIRWVSLVGIPLLAVVRVGATTHGLRQLLWSFLALGFLMIFVGVLAVTPGERLAVLGTSTLGVARASLVVPIVAFGFVLHERGTLIRAIALAGVPLSLVVALASGSRGPVLALLGVAFAAGVMHLVRGRTSGRRAALLALAGVAGGLSLVFIELPTASVARYDLLLAGLSTDAADRYVDTSRAVRLTLYEMAVARFSERPLIGHGTAAFAMVSESLRYPHNVLLQFAADLGALGLMAVATAIGTASLKRPRDRESSAIRLLMLFFLLNAMVSGDAYTDRTLWGLVLVLLLAVSPTAVSTDHARRREVAVQAVPTGLDVGVQKPRWGGV